jgi:archaellum biogenesis ATPase FlaH
MQPANPCEAAALVYARRGWRVIPLHTPADGRCSCGKPDCTSPGKHPRTAHGLKDASCDPVTIEAWWSRWADANVGILTGEESNLFIVDIDGPKGCKTLTSYEKKFGELPETRQVASGREEGGGHLYWEWPTNVTIESRPLKVNGEPSGLDFKGKGGYVVAPPSLHVSGRRYTIVNKSLPVPAPAWLVELNHAYAPMPALSNGSAAAGLVVQGNRHPTLASLRGSMAARGMPLAAIEAALVETNKTFSPPLEEDAVRKLARDMDQRYPQKASLPNGHAEQLARPAIRRMGEVEERKVDWLWAPFIPKGMLSMLSGDPGCGKSFIALDIAAGLSRGELPGGQTCEPAPTLYLTTENPLAEVIRPRLRMSRAVADMVCVLEGIAIQDRAGEDKFPISLKDIDILREAIRETRAEFLVIDPIQSYLGADVDMHRANETRPVLDRLARLVEDHHLACLLVRHLSKAGGGRAIYRGLGSIDLTGAVRSEMIAGSPVAEPENRALIHLKSNLGAMGQAQGYAIDAEGRFSWTGKSRLTASDLIADIKKESRIEEVKEWLEELLGAGELAQKDVEAQAERAGYSWRTVRRAENQLGVFHRKLGIAGGWYWNLSRPGPKMS